MAQMDRDLFTGRVRDQQELTICVPVIDTSPNI
jgi:hypothetical protein